MWFVIETVYFLSVGSDEVEGLYGPYSSAEDAHAIVRSLQALDAENGRTGTTYTVMQPEMF